MLERISRPIIESHNTNSLNGDTQNWISFIGFFLSDMNTRVVPLHFGICINRLT